MSEKQFSTSFPLEKMYSSRFSPRYAHSFETIIRNYNEFVIKAFSSQNLKSQNPKILPFSVQQWMRVIKTKATNHKTVRLVFQPITRALLECGLGWISHFQIGKLKSFFNLQMLLHEKERRNSRTLWVWICRTVARVAAFLKMGKYFGRYGKANHFAAGDW